MIKVYEENKRLKKELEELQKRYDIVSMQNKMVFNKNSYYENKIKELEKQINELRKELTELYKENHELVKKLPNDTTVKIKYFINELEHNIQADKDNGETLISGVSCDYVIGRLKDIIK